MTAAEFEDQVEVPVEDGPEFVDIEETDEDVEVTENEDEEADQ